MTKYIFSDCEYIRLGCKFYLDRNLETIAAAGKYSDGTNCFSVDSLGVVTSVNACSEFTTTTSTTTTSTTSTTTTSTTTTTAAPGPFYYTAQTNCPNDSPTGVYLIKTTSPLQIPDGGYIASTLYAPGSELYSGTRCFLVFNSPFGPIGESVTPLATFQNDDGDACTQCLQYVTPNYASGSWNTGFQAKGTGSLVRYTYGAGINGCLESNWDTGPGAQGLNITAFTVYVNSIQLTSGSSYNPNVTINGVSVPGLVYWPLGSSFNCGQSPLFIKHYYKLTRTTLDKMIFPNQPYLVNEGDRVSYYRYGANNPPNAAVVGPFGSSRTEVSVSPVQNNMSYVTINMSNSGFINYTTFG
jgi:hypothetical protein